MCESKRESHGRVRAVSAYYVGQDAQQSFAHDGQGKVVRMAINRDCEYYKVEPIKRNVLRNTLDEVEPVIRHLCCHPEAGPPNLTSKGCDLNNAFCPYNPKLNNQT